MTTCPQVNTCQFQPPGNGDLLCTGSADNMSAPPADAISLDFFTIASSTSPREDFCFFFSSACLLCSLLSIDSGTAEWP
jgi:hypothetical protein